MVLQAYRRTLAPAEALIEFLSADDRLVIFVLTHDRVRHIEVPVGKVELAERVHLAGGFDGIASRDTRANTPLVDLYSKLIAPVERAGFLDGIRSLIVVPPRGTELFAVRGSTVEGQLVERTVSCRAIYVDHLGIGVIAADDSRSPDCDTRVSSDGCCASSLGAAGDSRRSRGCRSQNGAATDRDRGYGDGEGFLREALLSSSIVHVASHGALNGESPMFSSVRLAPPGAPSNSNDNARLETHEVLSMSIRSELVFLSGCETALGPAWSSELLEAMITRRLPRRSCSPARTMSSRRCGRSTIAARQISPIDSTSVSLQPLRAKRSPRWREFVEVIRTRNRTTGQPTH